MIASITSGTQGVDFSALSRMRTNQPDDTSAETGDGVRKAHHPHLPQEAMTAAAQALGMSTDDVQSALSSGSTLADLATSKGVSQSDLQNTIATAITAGAAKHGRSLPSDQAADIAGHMVNGTPPPPPSGASAGARGDMATSGVRGVGGHGGHPPRGPHGTPPPQVTDAVSKLLGTSSSDLVQQLQSGSSLKDIASAAGVSATDLLSTVKSALAAAAPEGAAPPQSAIGELAQRMIERTGSKSDVGGVSSRYRASTSPSNVDELSSALKTEVTSLLQQLKAGVHLTDIASTQGVSSTDLTSSAFTGILTDTSA